MVHQDLVILSSNFSSFDCQWETHHIELPSKEWGSAVLRLPFVRSVALKEVSLCFERDADLLIRFDVSLSPVHYWNVTQPQRNDPSS